MLTDCKQIFFLFAIFLHSVIGRKVNMAARLMVQYPGKISLDSETFHYSNLPGHHFSILKVSVI